MIVEYIRYWIPFDQSDAFVAVCREAKMTLGASPYCVGFEASRGTEALEGMVLRIEWKSAEAYDQFHGSGEFHTLSKALQPFVKNIEEMGCYEPIPLQGS
jgi:quinol monooxygenase YgiN